jgi:hypothetical protein
MKREEVTTSMVVGMSILQRLRDLKQKGGFSNYDELINQMADQYEEHL